MAKMPALQTSAIMMRSGACTGDSSGAYHHTTIPPGSANRLRSNRAVSGHRPGADTSADSQPCHSFTSSPCVCGRGGGASGVCAREQAKRWASLSTLAVHD
eukprot:4403110-Prymnesium_polylepis.1